MSSRRKEVTLLVVSDIHDNIQKVRKLSEWHYNTQTKIDYVLCCGDIVTVPNGAQDKPGTAEKFNPILTNILQELEKIAHVIYVPGNHEPASLYQNISPSLSENSINIHKKIFKVDDDFAIIGLGGSVPILGGEPFTNEMIPFKDLDVKKVKYDGYPYNQDKNYVKSDEMLGNDLKELIKEGKNIVGEKGRMILLSHIGPLYTLTNIMVEEGTEDNLYLGSRELGKIFYEEEGIFLNIHGHTHDARGFITLNDNKKILNPGDLSRGHFAIVNIKRDLNDTWILAKNSLNKI